MVNTSSSRLNPSDQRLQLNCLHGCWIKWSDNMFSCHKAFKQELQLCVTAVLVASVNEQWWTSLHFAWNQSKNLPNDVKRVIRCVVEINYRLLLCVLSSVVSLRDEELNQAVLMNYKTRFCYCSACFLPEMCEEHFLACCLSVLVKRGDRKWPPCCSCVVKTEADQIWITILFCFLFLA